MLEGRRILITGGGGFVGWHLATRLIHKNEVTIYDTFEDDDARARRVPRAARLVEGDVLDKEALLAAASGQDLIVHLAAIVGVRHVVIDPVRTMVVTLYGTHNVLEAGERSGVDRVIVGSTSELYGEHAEMSSENDPSPVPAPLDARWAYAAAKLAADHLSIAFNRQHRVRTVVVRPFNIYGPGQEKGAIAEMLAAALTGGEIKVHGTGDHVRAYCYVDDLIAAVECMCLEETAVGEIFNIGNPQAAITSRRLAELVRLLSGGTASIVEISPRTADVLRRIPNVEKAVQLLRWHPQVGLEEGISRLIAIRRDATATT